MQERDGLNNSEDRWSEHGLGHLLNPRDLDDEDRDWIADVWLSIIRQALGLPVKRLAFGALPAIGRLTVSSPTLWHPLRGSTPAKHSRVKSNRSTFSSRVMSAGLGILRAWCRSIFNWWLPTKRTPRVG